MSKVMVEVEIIDGKYCRDSNRFCRCYWENEDGEYGCCITGNRADLEDLPEATEQYLKFENCPNPDRG